MADTAVKFEVGKTYETAAKHGAYNVKIVANQLGKLIGEARFQSADEKAAPSFIFIYNLDGTIAAHWGNFGLVNNEPAFKENLKLVLPEPPKPPIKAIRVHPKTGTSDEARHNLDTFLHMYDEGYIGMYINDPDVGTEDAFYSMSELKNTKYWSMIK